MISRGNRASLALGALLLGGCPPSAQPVCEDCYDTDGYELDFSSLASGTQPPVAVLFSGWRNGRCQNDMVCTGTPSVYLGDVRWGSVQWSVDCDPNDQEIIAFAGGQEPFIATPEVAPGTGLRLKGVVTPISFGGPRQETVKLWVVGDPSLTAAQSLAAAGPKLTAAWNESQTARRIFADAGTGIDLKFDVDSFPSSGFVNINNLYTNAACTLAGDLLVAPKGYDPDHLNVYYVSGMEGTRTGLDCYGTAPGPTRQNIMFVKGTVGYSAMRLAHEIGHGLGLLNSGRTPVGEEEPGDVDELALDPWLATNNLMRSGADEVKQVTLGQIYRIHFDKLSWKWSSARPPTPANSYPRVCQNSPVAGGLCPPLTLRGPQGWL